VDHETLVGEVSDLRARVKNLEGWQEKQNGSIQMVEKRVNQIYFWIIGLMGGVVASLILLLVNISIGR